MRLFPIIGFGMCVLLFWPGLVRPDSMVQMQQGVSGVLTDFHPPMMSFVWGLFHKIHSGSGPMFLWHLVLYWAGVTLFAKAEIHKAKWVYTIALLPPVFAYQLLVIKDISFVNAYLFCAAWLHFYSMRQDLAPSLASLGLWFVVLFYGTCSAYQAIAALPWLCLWIAKFYSTSRSKSWIIAGLLMFTLVTGAVLTFNNLMATPSHKSQHTKLYDLAGVSVNLDQSIFPEYIVHNSRYSLEKVKELYNTKRHDDLTFLSDGPLLISDNPDELNDLNKFWVGAILRHPLAYIKHRAALFKSQLFVSLLKKPQDIKGESTPFISSMLYVLDKIGLFTVFQLLMAYGFYFLWQIFYAYWGFRQFNKGPQYVSLFFQNAMGLSLVGALFFIAGAAEARYAYLAVVMVYFSCPFLLKSSPPARFIRGRFA